MKRSFPILMLPALFLAMSCGGGKDDKPKTDIGIMDAKELAENATEAMDESAKRREERRKRGDTLAMPYATLQGYLPEVDGYTKRGGPKGSQMNMPGMGSWSQAEQEYESGDKSIDVTMMDYNGAMGAFTGATALYSMGFSQEDDQRKSQSTDLGMKGVAAYETIYKQDQRAELVLVVGDRFLIQMDADGTNDVEVLKKAARSMKLGELAAK
jgi:hypothetical protein